VIGLDEEFAGCERYGNTHVCLQQDGLHKRFVGTCAFTAVHVDLFLLLLFYQQKLR
jgi:hypothetical protein